MPVVCRDQLDGRRQVLLGDDELRRRGVVGLEVGVEHLLRLTDSTSVRNSSVCGTCSSLSCVIMAAEPARTTKVTSQTTRARARISRASRPQRPLGVGVLGAVRRHAAARRPCRPSSTSAAGSSVSEASTAPAMPTAPTGPSPLQGGEVGEQQAQQAEDDGRPRREDRLERALVGDPHRVVLRLVVAQLLSEARHDQQGVVGGGADGEDEEDALRLAVEGQQVGRGHAVDRGRGEAEREHRGDQDHEAAGSGVR